MLAKKNRLIKKRDFDKIYKRGRIVGSKFFLVRFLSNNLNVARIGFVIGTRLNKSAVKRNRLKRQLREMMRGVLSFISSGYDIIISPRGISENSKPLELKEDLMQCLKKARLF